MSVIVLYGKGSPVPNMIIGPCIGPNLYVGSTDMWFSHKPGIRLPLLFARTMVTCPPYRTLLPSPHYQITLLGDWRIYHIFLPVSQN